MVQSTLIIPLVTHHRFPNWIMLKFILMLKLLMITSSRLLLIKMKNIESPQKSR